MNSCPECGALIENKDYVMNEIIECESCGVELIVVGTDPMEFELFEEEEK